MRKHEVALNKSGITFAGITTTLASRRCFCPRSVSHLHTVIYAIRRSNTTTTIYVEVHTVCLPLYLCGSAHCMFTFISMWECYTVCLPLYLCGSAHCMFTFISMWECTLYVYLYIYVEVHTVCLPLYLCGSAYCMFTFISMMEVHTVCLTLYIYVRSAHCMFTFISMWIVHTVCLPLYRMWKCILYVYLYSL